MTIKKPTLSDLSTISKILQQWTDQEEVDKYLERIKSEIEGHTEYNMHYWVIKDASNSVVGVSGIGDPYPKLSQYARGNNPGLLKIMYLNNDSRGTGLGKALLSSMEEEARKAEYDELILGSHSRYKDTAFGFYEKMGYEIIGRNDGSDETDYMEVFGKSL